MDTDKVTTARESAEKLIADLSQISGPRHGGCPEERALFYLITNQIGKVRDILDLLSFLE